MYSVRVIYEIYRILKSSLVFIPVRITRYISIYIRMRKKYIIRTPKYIVNINVSIAFNIASNREFERFIDVNICNLFCRTWYKCDINPLTNKIKTYNRICRIEWLSFSIWFNCRISFHKFQNIPMCSYYKNIIIICYNNKLY